MMADWDPRVDSGGRRSDDPRFGLEWWQRSRRLPSQEEMELAICEDHRLCKDAVGGHETYAVWPARRILRHLRGER